MQIYQYLSKYAHLAFKSPNIRTLFSECSYMNTNKPQQIWLNMNVCFYSIHSSSRISMRSRRLQRIKLTQHFNFPHPPQPVYLSCKHRVYCPLLRNQTAGVKRYETERDFVLLSICSLFLMIGLRICQSSHLLDGEWTQRSDWSKSSFIAVAWFK